MLSTKNKNQEKSETGTLIVLSISTTLKDGVRYDRSKYSSSLRKTFNIGQRVFDILIG